MDYDMTEIAASYDKARALAPQTARLWQDLLSAHIAQGETSLIIDLGCGTGRFSEMLAARFNVEVVGIDPSEKMIGQARRKLSTGRVSYRRGPAEVIPLGDDCADLVFMSNVYHHLNDPRMTALECRRVLLQNGLVCIRNGTRETDFPHRHFFPRLDLLIESELPPGRDIERVFVAGGFAPVVHKIVTQVVAPDWQSFVEKSSLRANSFLARLSDEDFEQGMAALRSPGDTINQNDPVTEEIAWFVFSRQSR